MTNISLAGIKTPSVSRRAARGSRRGRDTSTGTKARVILESSVSAASCFLLSYSFQATNAAAASSRSQRRVRFFKTKLILLIRQKTQTCTKEPCPTGKTKHFGPPPIFAANSLLMLIKASRITNLTDARYFAAREVDFL